MTVEYVMLKETTG